MANGEGGGPTDGFDPLGPDDPFIRIPGGADPFDPIGPPEDPFSGLGGDDGGIGDPDDPNAFQEFMERFNLDIVDLVNVGLGIGRGIVDVKQQKDLLKAQEQRIERARAAASPEQLIRNLQFLRPQFRELIAAGLGPQFQQGIASFLGKTGLADTGIGLTLGAAAEGAPEIFAFSSALDQAARVQTGQVSAELGLATSLPPGVAQNPILQALEGAARGLFSTPEKTDRPQGGAGSAQDVDLFPGLERR